MSTPKKIRKRARTATALSLAALIGMSAVTPAVASTETGDWSVSEVGYDFTDRLWIFDSDYRFDPNTPREKVKQGTSLGATDPELLSLADRANGVMSGSVSLSADPEQLARLKAMGITLDLAKSEEITNQQMASRDVHTKSQHSQWDHFDGGPRNLFLSVDYDDQLISDAAQGYGIQGATGSVRTYRDNFQNAYTNISTAEMWGVPSIKAGQDLTGAVFTFTDLANKYHPKTNKQTYLTPDHPEWSEEASVTGDVSWEGLPIATLYPVVSYVDGGEPEYESEYTTAPTTSFLTPIRTVTQISAVRI